MLNRRGRLPAVRPRPRPCAAPCAQRLERLGRDSPVLEPLPEAVDEERLRDVAVHPDHCLPVGLGQHAQLAQRQDTIGHAEKVLVRLPTQEVLFPMIDVQRVDHRRRTRAEPLFGSCSGRPNLDALRLTKRQYTPATRRSAR